MATPKRSPLGGIQKALTAMPTPFFSALYKITIQSTKEGVQRPITISKTFLRIFVPVKISIAQEHIFIKLLKVVNSLSLAGCKG